MKIKTSFLICAALLSLGACKKTTADVPVAVPKSYDQWIGKWTGPEGTYLDITKASDVDYIITIADLDGPKTFEGVSAKSGIEFLRDARLETIRAGNGEDTGMKWLADKQNCLVVKTGEGFCRD